MAPQRRKSGHIFAAFMAGPFNMKLRELSVLQDIQALQLISVNQSFASYQILKRMIPPPSSVFYWVLIFHSLSAKGFSKTKRFAVQSA